MPPQNFVILGGGISGLTAAWYLARNAPSSTKITLLEASNRFGGWIQSTRVGEERILFEQGPRTLRPSGLGAYIILDMAAKLNLTGFIHAVGKYEPAAKNRYLYYPDRLIQLPGGSLLSGLKSIVQNKFILSSLHSVIREPFIKPLKNLDDESIHDFISRRFNSTLADTLMSALVHGIYAGDAKKLSIKSTFKQIFDMEQIYGSVIKGTINSRKLSTLSQKDQNWLNLLCEENKDLFAFMSTTSLYSFANGIEQLVHAIVNDLKVRENVTIKMSHNVKELKFDKEIEIYTNDGTFRADHIISTIPSHELACLLPELPYLTYNPSVTVAVVNIAYGRQNLLPVKGFGYLIPHITPSNPYHVLGVVFDSDAMPHQDYKKDKYTKLTVMMGGHYYNDLSGNDYPNKDELLSQAVETIEKQLGVYSTPLQCMAKVHRKCIPQYYVGHYSRMKELHYAIKKKYGKRLSVGGASYFGVSINDCVTNSARLALDLLRNNDEKVIVTGLERVEGN
ncbi:Protoporphyrinogen oxidase [Gigaspora margarita]|uniref:Protoporphyrinogen oxidase n=1 Tax=Gigaspora margarita TaxID=4874 RepID=A0A8H3WXD8_GIGMA|nr:Protoporphyrinogen oxidase [Gigaspora margarita]